MSAPRFYCPPELCALAAGAQIALPPGAVRHAQVLRLQPQSAVTLWTGEGGQWQARITEMGRGSVTVQVLAHEPIEREPAMQTQLLVGVMASERMDWLVEKATELGAARITPVQLARSAYSLKSEQAQKKRQHWQAVAVAACEQCGRNRLPQIELPVPLAQALQSLAPQSRRYLLSLRQPPDGAQLPAHHPTSATLPGPPLAFLSGPEGGLTEAEEEAALQAGFVPVSLGPRVLRAETAPLALLAALQSPWAVPGGGA